jgi:hypothetical protein
MSLSFGRAGRGSRRRLRVVFLRRRPEAGSLTPLRRRRYLRQRNGWEGFFFFVAGMQDKRKGPPAVAEGPCSGASLSVRYVAGLGGAPAVRRGRWRFRLCAARPTHEVRAHAPEHVELCGLRLLGLAVVALVF